MKRLINDGDILDKYASLEEKSPKDHPAEKIGNFNWYGHRHISGTYSGAAYSTSLADGYMATDLRSSSNPRGSILKEAKNYTDAQIANINSAAIVQQANTYTDTKFTEAKAYTDQKVATIGGGGVHCYIIQPESYNASSKYQFAFYTSKEIQFNGHETSAANLFTAFPAFHTGANTGSGSYFPEIKYKVSLEQYPAYGRYQSKQVLFITITEYQLFVYTWDATNNKIVANKALEWNSSSLESRYWYLHKLY